MVKVTNSVKCNGKHILKANYLILECSYLKLFLNSSFLLFLAFFGLPGALLITGVCKRGHKFGPLHE